MGDQSNRWDVNIKMELGEIECALIGLAWDGMQF
jgi:hypothetical protein